MSGRWSLWFSVVCLLAVGACPAVALFANCQPALVSPAICKAAHVVPPSPQSGSSYCEVNSMGHCVASSGTQCVARYGIGVAGDCIIKLDYAHPTSCTLDYGVTVVDLPRYNAACTGASGTCRCEYTVDTMANPAQVQVCDCIETAL